MGSCQLKDNTNMIIKIKGREYTVEKRPCPDEGSVYYVTGKKGNRWFTLRNQNYPDMMFLMPENPVASTKTMQGVWLSDRTGTLEVVE